MNETLRDYVSREFKERNVDLIPMFPNVLVRVLPKEQVTSGGITLTDKDQNKPVHEGIVLATYEPFWQARIKAEDWHYEVARTVVLDDEGRPERFRRECQVKPGDHVIFPHIGFGITPVWPLDGGSGEWRLVQEGVIQGTLKYQDQPTEEWLCDLLHGVGVCMNPETGKVAVEILKNADVIRKGQVAKTVSGR